MPGTLYMVNAPGGRRRRKRKRSAKQRAATKKMLAARKKKLGAAKRARPSASKKARTTRRSPMARRKRRSVSTKRRRRSTARRRTAGAPVRLVRRGRTVYQGNPRRRRGRRRSSYRRNPGIFATVKQAVMDSGATLVGGAMARTVNGFVPLPNDGIIGAAKGIGVAVGIGMLARKVVSSDTARFVTAGAMQVPLKGLITAFIPGAGAFLGDYDNIGSYEVDSGVSDYLDTQNQEGMSGEETFVEAYEG